MRTRLAVVFAAMVGLGGFGGREAAAQIRGTVQQRSFTGPITGRTVSYNIYLPENYAAPGNTRRYPVVFHLHGLGGNQNAHNMPLGTSFESALAAGVIGPVIIVFPNGYTDAWWADSYQGAPAFKPAETDVLQVISNVDATFRTIPTRGARVVQGFSMGGFGATKFYSKFPDLFAACIEYDGALVTWQTMVQFQSGQASAIFGNNEAYFNQFSPWAWTVTNAPTLRNGPPIRMVVGALVGGNRIFRDHLLGMSIPVNYVETACGHELVCLLNAQGRDSAAFFASHMDLPCACVADTDCDGGVTIDDLLTYLGDFDAGQGAADVDDGSGTGEPDGGVTIDDLLYYLARFDAGC